MDITAKSLRSRVGETLACVDEGESVIIIYRGKPRAKLLGIDEAGKTESDGGNYPGFGMWSAAPELGNVIGALDAGLLDVDRRSSELNSEPFHSKLKTPIGFASIK